MSRQRAVPQLRRFFGRTLRPEDRIKVISARGGGPPRPSLHAASYLDSLLDEAADNPEFLQLLAARSNIKVKRSGVNVRFRKSYRG